jgi:hypothetical protein
MPLWSGQADVRQVFECCEPRTARAVVLTASISPASTMLPSIEVLPNILLVYNRAGRYINHGDADILRERGLSCSVAMPRCPRPSSGSGGVLLLFPSFRLVPLSSSLHIAAANRWPMFLSLTAIFSVKHSQRRMISGHWIPAPPLLRTCSSDLLFPAS